MTSPRVDSARQPCDLEIRKSADPACCGALAHMRRGLTVLAVGEFDDLARGRYRASMAVPVPIRCTASRSVPFLTSASSTRRTAFRSADHKCSRHRLYSPEMEYLDCARSNATAPVFQHHRARQPHSESPARCGSKLAASRSAFGIVHRLSRFPIVQPEPLLRL
jgi:hypothetical protein